MSYTAPNIDNTGLHIPSYADIRDDLIDKVKSIYGQDIYLENDSLDYQLISIFANKMYDVIQLLQMVYNGRSPVTAVGTNLDTIVKINGLQRQPTTLSNAFSIAEIALTGTAGTTFENLLLEDNNGYRWSQDVPLTFNASGNATGYFTCQTIGKIVPDINSISKIINPTIGVYTATNPSAVLYNTGISVETDAELRTRQMKSTALAGQSTCDSILGQILNVPNVDKAVLYENDTGSTDANGIPAHSICAVVYGGEDVQVANAIYATKTTGCGTYGNTNFSIASPYGTSTTIYFSRPTEYACEVDVSISAVGGKTITDTDQSNIQNAVQKYLDELEIGAPVVNSMLFYAAMTAQDDPTSPSFKVNSISVTVGGTSYGTSDVPVSFDGLGTFDSCVVTIV